MISHSKFTMLSFAIITLIAILPSLTLADGLGFINVKSIRFNPIVTVDSFVSFEGNGWPTSTPDFFSLAAFSQQKSSGSFSIDVKNDGYVGYVINFQISDSGKISNRIVTILLKNKQNDNAACVFTQQKISCTGGQLTMTVLGSGKRWTGVMDSYTFDMDASYPFSFTNGKIIGYKGGSQVLVLDLNINSFSYNYFPNHLNPASVSFQLDGGKVDWIYQPTTFTLKSTDVTWDFNHFVNQSIRGSGTISNKNGFKGSISLNAQGNLSDEAKAYIVRNEIYMNLNSIQYSDCPTFQQDHIFCYIRSGYIHSYIPFSLDTTFWKAPISIFTLEIQNGKATITGGQNLVGDVFQISNIVVKNLHFNQLS